MRESTLFSTTISAENCIDLLLSNEDGFSPLDVRSEGEFEKGQMPSSKNIPILENAHRRDVGISYKNQGQAAAIELGHQLVDPMKAQLVERWARHLKLQKSPVVFCWRGGLRSQMTQRWLADHGVEALRVDGGYKAIRNRLLGTLENLPSALVLSGRTGSRKTDLLKRLKSSRVVDLEGLANHRGSAFGLKLGDVQPSQATFENKLLLQISSQSNELFFEDESYLIGKRNIPLPLYKKMSAAPVIVMNIDRETRSQNIVDEYIETPIKVNPEIVDPLLQSFQSSIQRIGSKLGGALKKQVLSELEDAFRYPTFRREAHQKWVATLLEKYYDRAYDYSFSRSSRAPLFRGDTVECEEWLRERLARVTL